MFFIYTIILQMTIPLSLSFKTGLLGMGTKLLSDRPVSGIFLKCSKWGTSLCDESSSGVQGHKSSGGRSGHKALKTNL